ncbi:M14 family zinc carboxypeptidase [Roseburia hominis]
MKAIYEKLIKDIPEYKVFYTVDEMEEHSRKLAEAHPECVSMFEIGRTRAGEPLNCLKIGNGSHTALMFGCPHPNEPIGTMMLEYFTEKLAESEELRNELDYTWYVVKAWDTDGYRLNEKWLKGPFTLYNYSRNFFRPAGYKQVDWTFPIDYKELHFHDTIPETKAMMELIDKIRPEFIYSLHNAGFGGVYWYLTRKTPEIYEEMHQAAKKQEVPLNLGEPEAPYCVAWAPAIYQSLGIRQDYDYMEQYGGLEDMSKAINCGTCSADYGKEVCDAFTLLTELPYFFDERINDLSESDVSRKDVVLEKLIWGEESNKFVRSTLDISRQYMDKENPFLLALNAFSEGSELEATKKMIEENEEYHKTATVAEKFDNQLISKFYKLLSYGMLIRANESELEAMKEKGEQNEEKEAAFKKAFDIAVKAHKELADELEEEIHYQVVPIRKLVSIQLECGLLMAEYLKK